MDPANNKRNEFGPWESRRINARLMVFMRRRMLSECPVYADRLTNYIDVQRKRSKAAMSRRRSQTGRDITQEAIDNSAIAPENIVEQAVTQAFDGPKNNDDALEQERRSYYLRSRGGDNRQQSDKCRCRLKPRGGRQKCSVSPPNQGPTMFVKGDSEWLDHPGNPNNPMDACPAPKCRRRRRRRPKRRRRQCPRKRRRRRC